MEIGTHNSMTYLKPKKWYMYPFKFIAKCQSLTLEEQYQKCIRLFDIRISFDKNNTLEFRHGLIAYKCNVLDKLNWLNNQGDKIKVRLILELDKPNLIKETLFIKFCSHLKESYKNIDFYEARRKYDWRQLYDFPTLEITQLVGSMSGKLKYIIWPWLYAKRYNEKNLNTYLDYKPLLIDFYG